MVMQFRTIPLAQRQDIFFKLVTLQDAKSKGIRESKKIIIDQFQIDDATLEKITEEDGKILVYLHSDLSASELNHFLFSKNIALSHLVKRKNSLEAQFLELTKNAIIQNN